MEDAGVHSYEQSIIHNVGLLPHLNKVRDNGGLSQSKLICDKDILRKRIRQRMQVNGFYNEKKHGDDTLSLGVNECERQINHVVKIALSKIIQDLLTLKRNNLQ